MHKIASEAKNSPLAVYVGALLAQSGLSQTEFCCASGIDQGLMSKIVNGRALTINLETTLKLAKGFSVNPSKLISLSPKKDEWIVSLAWLQSMELTS